MKINIYYLILASFKIDYSKQNTLLNWIYKKHTIQLKLK